jgi:transposase-like protein
MKTATITPTSRALAHAEGVPDPEIPEKAKRRRFPAQYKLDVLAEYDRLTEPGAKGALLRREGLYSSQITDWRRARDTGAAAELGKPRGRRRRLSAEGVELERERRRSTRLEAELAKAQLVIEVQGKVSALFEAISKSAEPEPKSKP